MRAILAALFLGSVCAGAAWAGGVPIPTDQPKIVFVAGTVKPGDYDLFRGLVGSAQPDLIALQSADGRVDEALYIAAEIRNRGLNTVIYSGRHCASACALMFLAGEQKFALAGAYIGVAADTYVDLSGGEKPPVPIGRILGWLGVPPNIVTNMHSAGRTQIYWLSEDDKERLGIVTLRAGEELPAVAFSAPRFAARVTKSAPVWPAPATLAVSAPAQRSKAPGPGAAPESPEFLADPEPLAIIAEPEPPEIMPVPEPREITAGAEPEEIVSGSELPETEASPEPPEIPYLPVPDELPATALPITSAAGASL